jgi:trimethylamine---corrinoid protein Co-methyltransferase
LKFLPFLTSNKIERFESGSGKKGKSLQMIKQRFQLLSEEEIRMVHEASLEVLETTGLRLNHPVALDRLSAAGAKVDTAREQVRLPAELVEKALETAPKYFLCAGREKTFDRGVARGSSGKPLVRVTAGTINHYDLITNESRPLTLKDCRNIARLIDGLENLDMAGFPIPEDVPGETYDLHVLKVMLEAGRKHIWALPRDSTNLKYQLEMMKAVAGGSQGLQKRPLCSGIVCLIEPLYFPSDEIERLLLYGEVNLPVKVPLAPMFGANAPYTLAGALTYTNAEALGSLVLLQTLCPGIPTWYYILPSEMNMAGGNTNYHSPEIMLITSGLAQLADHYNIPSGGVPFNTSDCQAHQIIAERSTALTMYALSGITEMGGAGMVDGGVAISPLALVIDDELSAYVRRLVEGFEIDRDKLAVEAINRVGHHGSFLSDPHTLKFLRGESRFRPALFDWRPHEAWSRDGKTILERARDRMMTILSDHEVPPLEEKLQKELEKIVQTAEKG